MKNYFQKAPDGAKHEYAIGRQIVRNLGGYSAVRINQPAVNTEKDERISLSQQWYAVGSIEKGDFQSIEVGWMVNPKKYDPILPAFFVFYTPDAYKTNCYNLECKDKGFVQTDSSFPLGGVLNPVTEIGISLIQKFAGSDAWWLYVVDTSNGKGKAIGYYPVSLFGNGALYGYAERATFGGETVVRGDSWPPMGNGEFGTADRGKASYQRLISYRDMDGKFQPASLNTSNPSKCYKPKVENTVDWMETLYYGGPGGTDCKSQ